MFASFRQSMAWLHTWFGLALGYVLMACFFFGALSVFDREIDRWALPDTRFEPQPMPSFDKILQPAFARLEPDPGEYANNIAALHDPAKGAPTPRLQLPADEYWAYTTHRDPVLAIGAGFRVPRAKDPAAENHIHGNATIDPRNGAFVRSDELRIGSQWFFPMHYSLNWNWKNLGIFTVGFAGLVMLAALLTGVVMHRKFFREFFTFRPARQTQRSLLDLHNLSGVLALPFHFFFSFTGLLIFAAYYYFPVSQFQLKPLHDQHEVIEAGQSGLPHSRAGIPASLASVDAMMAEARRRWAARDMAGQVGFLQIHHLGDANGYVSIYRAGSDRVALVGEAIHFKASTGEVLREEPAPAPVPALNEFLTGLHLQHFEHWTLRWLYVLGGVLGCVCITTGFLFFVGKRKQQHAKNGSQGARVVDALAVGGVTGMLIASIGILLANRLLPAGMAGKGEWEQKIFWGLWALAFVHAALRSAPVTRAQINPAWREQCWVIALLALASPLANWLTTGDHLVRTLFTAPYLAVAGVDLSLLACAMLAIVGARLLAQRERLTRTPAARTEAAHV